VKSNSSTEAESADGAVGALVEDVFRRSAGRIVASLTRALGPQHLALAEESVQDALVAALQKWPWSGVPESPEAWLTRVARNRALDRLRRSDRWEADLTRAVEAISTDRSPGDGGRIDDELAMVFMCAHPSLSADAAVALTLRTVGGLSTREIARAFLVPEATMAQRVVRARRRFADITDPFDFPADRALPERRGRVLKVLYLMFNEGHVASEGEDWVRGELCREAVRLTELLGRHPSTAAPEVDALLALFLFQAGRLPARASSVHGLVPLADQDRSLWDQALIARGFVHLDRARGGPLTAVHLEAGIAAEHSIARSFDETAWDRIVRLYDHLLLVAPSIVVRLNRAVAVGMWDGADAGLAAMPGAPSDAGHEFAATRAFLLDRGGRRAEAAAAWRDAAERARSEPVRRYFVACAAAAESVQAAP
jgi:RNA polymerase sigma-70 factor (ECF subfamily)